MTSAEENLRPRKRASANRRLGGIMVAAGLLIILAFGMDWTALDRNPAQDIPEGLEIGRRAPDFETVNLDGDLISLSDQVGQVVLLNFWATWCGPCRIEMPFMQAAHEQYPDDLAILAVDFDEPADLVAAFKEELGIGFPLLLDPGAIIQEQYQIRAYPTSFFIDREGVIRAVHIGVMSAGQLGDYLADLGLQ